MWGYYEYVPVAKKKENAKKQLEKLQKNGEILDPVVITGAKLAKTWWGIAWNKNLESYADYSNRIGRGRSYVRNGGVIDLSIDTGVIRSKVSGSSHKAYQIVIAIDPIAKSNFAEITKTCSNSISNIEDLMSGVFPEALASLFTQKGKGLFPSPKEIHFDCNCPDWAFMCKHIAATLYGVGNRLDSDPSLFFKLRDIKVEALMKKSIEAKMEAMLSNSNKKTKRVMEDGDISAIFGITGNW